MIQYQWLMDQTEAVFVGKEGANVIKHYTHKYCKDAVDTAGLLPSFGKPSFAEITGMVPFRGSLCDYRLWVVRLLQLSSVMHIFIYCTLLTLLMKLRIFANRSYLSLLRFTLLRRVLLYTLKKLQFFD